MSKLLSNIKVYSNQYGKYCVPLECSHTNCATAIMLGLPYEGMTIKKIIRSATDGVVVHAGAFFGDFLPALSKHCKHVYAFEPNPRNYECAKETIRINGLENVELWNEALSVQKNTASMLVKKKGVALGGMSRLHPRGQIHVQTISLDERIGMAHVDLIHLDVEQHEGSALMGAIKLIERCKPIIIVETLPDVAVRLYQMGYKIGGRIDNNTVLLPPEK